MCRAALDTRPRLQSRSTARQTGMFLSVVTHAVSDISPGHFPSRTFPVTQTINLTLTLTLTLILTQTQLTPP